MSNTIEIVQTIILIILLDRQLILRNKYKIAIENYYPFQFDLWIYCKKSQNEVYTRDGGKYLFRIDLNIKKRNT